MRNAKQLKPILNHNTSRIIVASASARALAASSLRAGRAVSTIDLFADADTAAICRQSNRHLRSDQAPNFAWQCESMDQILERVEQLLADPDFQDHSGSPTFLLGGGLENSFRDHAASHKLIEQCASTAFSETGRWQHVNDFCLGSSVRFPSTTRKLNAHQAKERWLVKTDFSSGGLGVQFAQPNTTLESDQYFQKHIDGLSISACYVAASVVDGEEFPDVEMLGICEPVSSSGLEANGRPPNQSFPFQYAGSIGPINLSRFADPILAEFKRVGILVANRFGLCGVFGIDFILEQDRLWLLEINPRITASAELIEYAARETMPDFSIVQLHLDALSPERDEEFSLFEACQRANTHDRIYANRIVYRHHEATRTLRMTRLHIEGLKKQFTHFTGECDQSPELGAAFITDLPEPKTEIAAGHPILTLHVSADSQSEAGQALARAFRKLERLLGERLS